MCARVVLPRFAPDSRRWDLREYWQVQPGGQDPPEGGGAWAPPSRPAVRSIITQIHGTAPAGAAADGQPGREVATLNVQHEVDGLDAGVLRRAVERLLAVEPGTGAVLLTGSFAKGTATRLSDLDLVAITGQPQVRGYRMWFEDRPEGPPLHVSAGVSTPEEWLAKGSTPAHWSLGFPAMVQARYLWGRPEAQAELGASPSLRHPPGVPHLGDFVEWVVKAGSYARAQDEPGLRWFAHIASSLAPGVLIPLNPPRVVGDRREALDAALNLGVAPAHYAEDLRICLGLAAATAREVHASIGRLGQEVVALLREQAPGIDPQPDISRYLTDGTLGQHVSGVIE